MITTFTDLGLSDQVLKNITALGFTEPTPIQAQALPPALEGRDVIGGAQTGTGKTAAFVIPMLERPKGQRGSLGLILVPTRELALQVEEVIRSIGKGMGMSLVTIIGGTGYGKQDQGLRQQATFIIATPGRLLDHLGRGTVRLDNIRMLVLDEADRMLDMGFAPQINKIFARLPRERQTLLFSATIPPQIAELSRAALQNPVTVRVSQPGQTAQQATHDLYRVPQDQKLQLLLWLLAQKPGTALIFTRTKHRADKVARVLERHGLRAGRLHSNRSLNQRTIALDDFKAEKSRILVATDIAARGLDVAHIALVVNFDLPHVAEDYVHRIGRTARANAVGHASSFVSPDEQHQLRDIERYLRKPITVVPVPADLPVLAGPAEELGRERGRRFERTEKKWPHQGPHERTATQHRNQRFQGQGQSRGQQTARPQHSRPASSAPQQKPNQGGEGREFDISKGDLAFSYSLPQSLKKKRRPYPGPRR